MSREEEGGSPPAGSGAETPPQMVPVVASPVRDPSSAASTPTAARTTNSYSTRTPGQIALGAGGEQRSISPPEEEEDKGDGKLAGISRAAARQFGELERSIHEHIDLWEEIMRFCFIALGAYIGTFFRMALSRLRVWEVETTLTGLAVGQIIGCVIMGFLTMHKQWFTEKNPSLIRRVTFVGITAGLCGSLTTFSGWSLECNKTFFLQWDLSWGNYAGSYHAGRFIESCLCLWTGVVLPMSALHLGMHLAEYSPFSDKRKNYDAPDAGGEMGGGMGDFSAISATANSSVATGHREEAGDEEEGAEGLLGCLEAVKSIHLELALVLFYIFFTFLIIGLAVNEPQWILAALFGSIGAYLRLRLTALNANEEFPIGTFVANVGGSWILAAVVIISRLGCDYNDVLNQSFLYGLAEGLCGCLTTVSTFVLELTNLHWKTSIAYALSTIFLAQVGFILLFDAPLYASVPAAATDRGSIDLCAAHAGVCAYVLSSLACPNASSLNDACGNATSGWGAPLQASGPEGLRGACVCGGMDVSDSLAAGLLRAQLAGELERAQALVWPKDPAALVDPGAAMDLCITHNRLCGAWLDRVGCPWELREQQGCVANRLGAFSGVCECGNATVGAGLTRLAISEGLARQGGGLARGGDSCLVFEDRCGAALSLIACPFADRVMSACNKAGWFVAWEARCACGALNLSGVVEGSVLEGALEGYVTLVPRLAPTPGVGVDLCASLRTSCNTLLESMQCPQPLRVEATCDAGGRYTGACICGNMSLDSFIAGWVARGVGARAIDQFRGARPRVPPYTLAVSADPFRALFEGD